MEHLLQKNVFDSIISARISHIFNVDKQRNMSGSLSEAESKSVITKKIVNIGNIKFFFCILILFNYEF